MTTIANLLKLSESEGYAECPACKGAGKLKYGPYNCKCFRTSCVLNKGVTNEGLAKFLGVSLQNKPVTKTIRDKVFEGYVSYLKNNPELYDYLIDRGYENAIEKIEVGYAPSDVDFLLSVAPVEQLKKQGMLYNKNLPFFRDRYIFAIKDKNGNVVHMQGRSNNPFDELRWLSTKTVQGGLPINSYLFNAESLLAKSNCTFLCEGISDCMSLINLGVTAVATLGLEPKLKRYYYEFKSNSKSIVAIYDNDLKNVESGGMFKSWDNIINHLLDLKYYSKLPVYVVVPPLKYGKDVNDWCKSVSTKEEFLKEVQDRKIELLQFVKSNLSDLQVDPVDLLRFASPEVIKDVVANL